MLFKTDIGMIFDVKQDQACVFCQHCNNIWYDHHGPYLIDCDLEEPYADVHNSCGECKQFKLDKESIYNG